MAKRGVIPPTELERHVNHPNFKRLEETEERFIVFMNSVKVTSGEFNLKKTKFFNIDKSSEVANLTYSLVIKKKLYKNDSRI